MTCSWPTKSPLGRGCGRINASHIFPRHCLPHLAYSEVHRPPRKEASTCVTILTCQRTEGQSWPAPSDRSRKRNKTPPTSVGSRLVFHVQLIRLPPPCVSTKVVSYHLSVKGNSHLIKSCVVMISPYRNDTISTFWLTC